MKKTNLLISLISGLLFSATSLAAVPTTESLKAEPVSQESVLADAKASLAITFSTIEVKTDLIKLENKISLAKQKTQTNKNKPVTLTKTSLLAE